MNNAAHPNLEAGFALLVAVGVTLLIAASGLLVARSGLSARAALGAQQAADAGILAQAEADARLLDLHAVANLTILGTQAVAAGIASAGAAIAISEIRTGIFAPLGLETGFQTLDLAGELLDLSRSLASLRDTLTAQFAPAWALAALTDGAAQRPHVLLPWPPLPAGAPSHASAPREIPVCRSEDHPNAPPAEGLAAGIESASLKDAMIRIAGRLLRLDGGGGDAANSAYLAAAIWLQLTDRDRMTGAVPFAHKDDPLPQPPPCPDKTGEIPVEEREQHMNRVAAWLSALVRQELELSLSPKLRARLTQLQQQTGRIPGLDAEIERTLQTHREQWASELTLLQNRIRTQLHTLLRQEQLGENGAAFCAVLEEVVSRLLDEVTRMNELATLLVNSLDFQLETRILDFLGQRHDLPGTIDGAEWTRIGAWLQGRLCELAKTAAVWPAPSLLAPGFDRTARRALAAIDPRQGHSAWAEAVARHPSQQDGDWILLPGFGATLVPFRQTRLNHAQRRALGVQEP